MNGNYAKIRANVALDKTGPEFLKPQFFGTPWGHAYV